MKKILFTAILLIGTLTGFGQKFHFSDTTGLDSYMGNTITRLRPTAASYTIVKRDANIYAIPSYELSAFSGTDPAVVINSAISALTEGGTIFITKSVVDSTSTSIVDNGVDNIELIFEAGSLIKAKDSTNFNPGIYLTSVNHWRITGFNYDGNKQGQRNAHWSEPGYICAAAVHAASCTNIIVEKANIQECMQYGVYFPERDTACVVKDSYFKHIDWDAIHIGNNVYAWENSVINNTVILCGDIGIGTYGQRTKIIGNFIQQSAFYNYGDQVIRHGASSNVGIGLENNADDCIVTDNIIYGCRNSSISLEDGCDRNLITNNKMFSWDGQEEYNPCISLKSDYNVIDGNTFYKASGYGDCIVASGGNYNVIQNNNMVGRRGVTLQDNSDFNIVKNNWIKGAAMGVQIIADTENSNRIIENDFDASADDVSDVGTGTIIGNNVWHDGSYDATIP